MTASTGTVLANLIYLIGAVVLAVIVSLIAWLRHRQPKSIDANMATFRKGLSVLAPDSQSARSIDEQPRVRPSPVGLSHVRIEPRRPVVVRDQPDAGGEEAPVDPAGGTSG